MDKLLLSIIVAFLCNSAFAQWEVQNYYSTSDCSGTSQFQVGTASSDCTTSSCTPGTSNYWYTITCASTLPSDQSGFVTELVYNTTTCSNSAVLWAVIAENTCLYTGSYQYVTCSGGTVSAYVCPTSSCSPLSSCTVQSLTAGSCQDFEGTGIHLTCGDAAALSRNLALIACAVLVAAMWSI